MLRPTAQLVFTVYGDETAPNSASSIKCAFAYVCPVAVRLQNPETVAENPQKGVGAHIDMRVLLPGTPYYLTSDGEADTIWRETVGTWINFKCAKVFNTIDAFNDSTAHSFTGQVRFDAITFNLEGCLVTMPLPAISGYFPHVVDGLDKLRQMITAGEVSAEAASGCVIVEADEEMKVQKPDAQWFISLKDGNTFII